MSKVSAMQSLREARYAAARTQRPAATAPSASGSATTVSDTSASATTLPATRPARAQPVEAAPAVADALDPAGAADLLTPAAAPSTDDEAPAEEALCGHRSMNNRLCRRPAGHAEKNHRYN